MDCIIVVQEKDWWRAPVSTVINLRIPECAENILVRWGSISFFKRDFCIELICTHTVLFILRYVHVGACGNRVKLTTRVHDKVPSSIIEDSYDPTMLFQQLFLLLSLTNVSACNVKFTQISVTSQTSKIWSSVLLKRRRWSGCMRVVYWTGFLWQVRRSTIRRPSATRAASRADARSNFAVSRYA